MKSSTILKLKAVGMAGILGASAMFAGCPSPSDGTKSNPCTCPNGTEHDEPCPCGGDDCTCTVRLDCNCEDKAHLGIGETCDCGGEDCACGLKVYGQLANGVKIYRSGEVSDAEMAMAVANAIAGYNGLDDTAHDDIQGKIDEIHIIKDMKFYYKSIGGKLVFALRADLTGSMKGLLVGVADGSQPLGTEVAIFKGVKDVKLAKAVLTPRQNAVLGKFARTQQVMAVRRGMVLRGNQRLG